MNFKQQILRYWLAMNVSAFDAAVHAGAAFLGVAGAHAAVDSIPALNLRQFAAVFLIAFGRAVLAYLDAHPVESLLAQRSEAGDPRPEAVRSSSSSSSSSSPPMLDGGGHQSAATPAATPAPQPPTRNPQP